MDTRPSGRRPQQMREVRFELDYTKWAEGSVLCAFGDTWVLCTASVEERVPPWMNEPGRGWVTGEYAMLPRSTDRRNRRESTQGKVGGRTQEISRLVGRSLRAAVDLDRLGERTITVDCDVLQADGGTRTAAITGGWLALALAIKRTRRKGLIAADPVARQVAAVSVGLFGSDAWVDLDFAEDQRADADINLVMTSEDTWVEVQGTAEKQAFDRATLNRVLDAGAEALRSVFELQSKHIEDAQ